MTVSSPPWGPPPGIACSSDWAPLYHTHIFLSDRYEIISFKAQVGILRQERIVVVNAIKRFAKVNKAHKDCSRVRLVIVKVPMHKVQHLNKVMFNRTPREAPQLVRVKVGAYIH